MRAIVCDICGQAFSPQIMYLGDSGYHPRKTSLKIKIYESGCTKLDVCHNCTEKIIKYCKDSNTI